MTPSKWSRRELQGRAAKGATWTMVHTLVSLPLAFLANIALARWLGVEGYGRLAFLTLLLQVASSIAGMGLGSGLIQFGSKFHAMGDTSSVSLLLSKAQWIRIVLIAPILSIVVYVAADVPLAMVIPAVILGIWVPNALEGARTSLQIENRTAAAAKYAMVQGILVQTVALIAAWQTRSPDAVWLAKLAAGAATVIFAMAIIEPAYRRAVLVPKFPKGMPKGFWRFTIPTGLAGIIGGLVVSRSELFFLNFFSSAVQVGLYALAFGLAAHIFAPAQALTGPLIPALSGLKAIDPGSLPTAFTRVLRTLSTSLSLILCLGLIPLALLIPHLYGQEFASVPPMFAALTMVGTVTVLAGPVKAFVMARHRGDIILFVNLCALVLDVILCVLLIPSLGAWGAVLGNTAAALVSATLLISVEVRENGIELKETLRSLLPLPIAFVAIITAWLVTQRISIEQPVGEIASAAIIGGLMTLLGLRLTKTGLTVGDQKVIVGALPRWLQPFASGTFRVILGRSRVADVA